MLLDPGFTTSTIIPCLKDLQILILRRIGIVLLDPAVVIVMVLGGDVLVKSNDLVGKFRVAHIDSYVLAELLPDLPLRVIDLLQTGLQSLSVHLFNLILLLFHALHFLAKFLFEIRHAIHILQRHVLVLLKLYHTEKK